MSATAEEAVSPVQRVEDLDDVTISHQGWFRLVEVRRPWSMTVEQSSDVFFYMVLDGEAVFDAAAFGRHALRAPSLVNLMRGVAHTVGSGGPGAPALSWEQLLSSAPRARTVPLDHDRLLIGRMPIANVPYTQLFPPLLFIDERRSAFWDQALHVARALELERLAPEPREGIVSRLVEVFVNLLKPERGLSPRHIGVEAEGRLRTILGPLLFAVHAEPQHPWTIKEMAARARMSPSVLFDHFRQLMGFSPMQYVALVRVERAKDLLFINEEPVGDIGREVGYRSYDAFHKAFRKAVGVSPSEYRHGRGGHPAE